MSVDPVRRSLALLVLIGLAAVLISLLPVEALARPIFQSPLPGSTPTVSPTLPATATRQAVTPVAAPPTSGPDAGRPIGLPADAPMAAPPAPERVPGFLPPPTLSAPGGQPPSLLPGPGQPLTAPPAPTPTPRPVSAAADDSDPAGSLARLIDTAVIAVSYLWLCCGIFVLIGITLGLVWLARDKGRT